MRPTEIADRHYSRRFLDRDWISVNYRLPQIAQFLKYLLSHEWWKHGGRNFNNHWRARFPAPSVSSSYLYLGTKICLKFRWTDNCLMVTDRNISQNKKVTKGWFFTKCCWEAAFWPVLACKAAWRLVLCMMLGSRTLNDDDIMNGNLIKKYMNDKWNSENETGSGRIPCVILREKNRQH